MRVCHICSNYDKFFENFMEEQRKKGLKLRVFYFRARERGWPDVTSSYVDVRLNYSNWQRPFFYLKEQTVLKDFFSIYKKHDFDIVHAHTLFSNGYIALKVKKHWGLPYIVAVRDVDVNIFFKYRINLRAFGVRILNEAERIIFLSPMYRDYVLSKYIPMRLRDEFYNKSLIIPNGIDPYFLNNKVLKSSIDRDRPIQIITVGYVCKRKNQLSVCDAAKLLNSSGIKTTYTIIGKILDKRIMNKINKYPFVNYKSFLPKEELIEEYRRSDIYVMPSITETFGLTYAEAMSQGLPVIYTKGQGFDGQFEDGVVGYSVNCFDAQDIANKVIKILDKYEEHSRNCVRLCNKFDWGKIAVKYIELYESIVKGENL